MKTSFLFEVSLIHQPWWADTHKILISYAFKLIPLFYANVHLTYTKQKVMKSRFHLSKV